MDTTRMFPRSLADAFPEERAACMEGPDGTPLSLSDKRNPFNPVPYLCAAAAIGLLLMARYF